MGGKEIFRGKSAWGARVQKTGPYRWVVWWWEVERKLVDGHMSHFGSLVIPKTDFLKWTWGLLWNDRHAPEVTQVRDTTGKSTAIVRTGDD